MKMASSSPSSRTIGAVLAGGLSRRFGAPKAVAPLAGVPMIQLVVASLRSSVDTIVVSTNDPSVLEFLDLPTVPDRFPDRGPVAGIHATLDWASARDADGICCVP